MTFGDTITIRKFALKHATGCVLLSNSTDNFCCQCALPVTAAAIIQRIFSKMISSVLAERVNNKILHAIVGAHAIFVMNGETVIGRIKKRERDNAVRKRRDILALLAKNAGWVADTSGSLAQYTPMQTAAVNADPVQTSYATKSRRLINTFVAGNGFPSFGCGLSHNHAPPFNGTSLYTMRELHTSKA